MASAVIVIFLLHLRSTVSVLVTLPLSVGLCFILMFVFGVDSNIMSLAGIAISDYGDVLAPEATTQQRYRTGLRASRPAGPGGSWRRSGTRVGG